VYGGPASSLAANRIQQGACLEGAATPISVETLLRLSGSHYLFEVHSLVTLYCSHPPYTLDSYALAPTPQENLPDAGKRDSGVFHTAENALANIATLRSVSADLLQQWVVHPDERVPEALLRRRHLASALTPRQRVYLVHRADASATHREVLWTPLLDSLHRAIYHFRLRTPEVRRAMPVFERRLHELGKWIASSAGIDDVTALLAFHSHSVEHLVASRGAVFNTEVVQRLARSEANSSALLTNPFLGEVEKQFLLRFAVEHIDNYFDRRNAATILYGLTHSHEVMLETPHLAHFITKLSWYRNCLDQESYSLLRAAIIKSADRRFGASSASVAILAGCFGCGDSEIAFAALQWLADMPATEAQAA
jgi:hypothetical protein